VKSPPTKSSTPRLSELARHVVVPKDAVSTGWPAVQAKCADLGIRFRPWQPGVGKIILCKRRTGKYAATIGGTGLSIPRQVGKTFLVGAIVFALCLLRPNLTVIWTAHRLRTAEETFGKMLVFAKRRKIKPHILKTPMGSGEEAIIFRNGSRILFGARERGFGRGFDEVDVLIFDEAQILTDNALDDMVPATNQSRQETGALLLFLGTPPKPTDPSEVFTRMRRDALAGEDDDTGWIEFGADPGYEPTPKPAPLTKADLAQVAKANPTYPDDTPLESILRMRKQLNAESWPREGLGIWDAIEPGVLGGWVNCCAAPGDIGAPSIALDVALDRSYTSIGIGARRSDERIQVELAAYERGTAWAIEECKRLHADWSVPVTVAGSGPAAALIPDLETAGVPINVLSSAEVAQACAAMADAVKERTVAPLIDETGHPDSTLAAATAGAHLRPGESFVFTRKGSVDISPLYAVTLARWVAATAPDYDLLASVY